MGAEEDSLAYYWVGAFYAYVFSYPLAILVLACRWKPIIRRAHPDYEFLGYLGVWVLIVLAGMSVPGTKKMRYLLPIVPALSLLAAYILIHPAPKGVLYWTRRVFLGLCYYAVLAGAIVGLAAWPLVGPYFPASMTYYGGAMITLAVVAAATVILHRKYHDPGTRAFVAMIGAVLALVVTEICLVNPANQSMQQTRPFVEKVEALLEGQSRSLVFYQIGLDQEAIKFVVNARKPIQPQSVQTPKELVPYLGKAFFIAEEKDYARLPPRVTDRTRILFKGRIGKRDCLVFVDQGWTG
jgi:4-amino-4-deoxy-L-arabinose transferase-like glycosyltransferase